MSESNSARPPWVPDEQEIACEACQTPFTFMNRRHHCRACGHIFCSECSQHSLPMPASYGYAGPQRVCFTCYENLSSGASSIASDEALAVQFYLRALNFDFKSSLGGFGRRPPIDKSYYLINARDKNQSEVILSLISAKRAPLPLLGNDSNQRTFLKIVTELAKHPFIAPVLTVQYVEEKDKVIVLRQFTAAGSLKDFIRSGSPKLPYAKKYSSAAIKQKLPFIARCGKQILLALQYLQSIGISFPHLHSANVLMYDGNCCLSDLETSFLGLAPLYNSYSNWQRNPNGGLEIDFFGQILFEMITGNSISSKDIIGGSVRVPPTDVVPQPLQGILQSIWSESPPSIDDLLKNAFFASVNLPQYNQNNIAEKPKLSTAVNQFLAAHNANLNKLLEARLDNAISPTMSPAEISPRSSISGISGNSAVSPRELDASLDSLRIDQSRPDPLANPRKVTSFKKKRAVTVTPATTTAVATATSDVAPPPSSLGTVVHQRVSFSGNSGVGSRSISPTLSSSTVNAPPAAPLASKAATTNEVPPVPPPRRPTSPPVAKASSQPTAPPPAKSAAPPPPAPPKAPPKGPPAPPPAPPKGAAPKSQSRDLLTSIEGFSSKKLKKTKTNDRSAPLVKK